MSRRCCLFFLTLCVLAGTAAGQPLPDLPPSDTSEAAPDLEAAPPPDLDLAPQESPAIRPIDPEAQRQIDALGRLYDADAAAPAPENPATPAGTATPLADGLQAFASLCIVLAIIALLVWALRRFGRRNPLLAGQHFGKILGRLYLTPQASLHFVQIGSRVLAVGVTAQHVALLAEFHPDELDVEQPEGQPGSGERPMASSFLEELKASSGDWKTPSPQHDDLSELRGDLQRLQAYLRERVREPGE